MSRPLDRKLLRDLARMKGQAVAIALVVAAGVLLLVMMDGLVNSLSTTRDAYYRQYRLADVFAPVKRAPSYVADSLSRIDGVAAVQTRIFGSALIDLHPDRIPIRAQVVSLPESGQPLLNQIHLTSGRLPEATDPDEAVLLDGFARAHGFRIGDGLTVNLNGSRRNLRIIGTALSPEFLYPVAPGDMAPDDERFAVIWAGRKALESAYDMEGAFNQALLGLTPGAGIDGVLATADRMLKPFGSTGAYTRDDNVSERFISEEISGLRGSSRTVPPVFLLIAAFLLYIVLSRTIQAERQQVGLLKAFGYNSFEIGLHYLKFIMIIAVAGSALGCLLGVVSGRRLAGVYQLYYKFPFLYFSVDPMAFISAIGTSLISAMAGGALALRRIFGLMPAVAMQPPSPPDYSHSISFGGRAGRILDQTSKIIVRRFVHHPWRAFVSVAGISAGMALSVSMHSLMSSFNSTMNLTFEIMDRSDLTLTFAEPLSETVVHELQSMEGVIEVEPSRNVPVIFHHGRRSWRGTVTGLVASPELYRVLDRDQNPAYVRADGVLLGRALADILDVRPGGVLRLDVREGRCPTIEIPVAGVVDTFIGAPAFFELDQLNRVLREPKRVSCAYLRIDSHRKDELFRQFKQMPAIAGVSLKQETRDSLQELLDSGAGAMRFIMAAIAAVITFGIVYNSARIAFAEMASDLAILRVLGFSRGETASVLLGELTLMTLMAIPIGMAFGVYLNHIIATGFSNDIYQIPALVKPESHAIAAITVIASAFASGWFVRRDVINLDFLAAIKTRV